MIENYVFESHIRLRLMREALTLTRKEFSGLLQVKYRTYNRWEKIDTPPSVTAQKVMIRFGLNPHYLYGDKEVTVNNVPFEKVKESIFNFLTTN